MIVRKLLLEFNDIHSIKTIFKLNEVIFLDSEVYNILKLQYSNLYTEGWNRHFNPEITKDIMHPDFIKFKTQYVKVHSLIKPATILLKFQDGSRFMINILTLSFFNKKPNNLSVTFSN